MITTTITLKIDETKLTVQQIKEIQKDMVEEGEETLSIEAVCEYVAIMNFCGGSYSYLNIDTEYATK